MNHSTALCGTCLLLVLFGCSKEDKQDIAQQSNISNTSQSAQLDALGRSVVARKCPDPISIESEQVKNKHDPNITDEIRKIKCDGYTIQIYLANFIVPAKELPMALTVYRKLDYIKPSQYIASEPAEVIKAYGTPLQNQGNDIVYRLGTEEDFFYNYVTYKIKNGLVDEVTWDWDME